MEAFLTAFTGAVSGTELWAALAPVGAVIGGFVLFAFAFSRVRNVIKGASKGKAKV